MFIFVFIYGCQLRDVTMQSEALFGPQSNSINNNALLIWQAKLSIFLVAVADDLLEKFSSFFSLVYEGNSC